MTAKLTFHASYGAATKGSGAFQSRDRQGVSRTLRAAVTDESRDHLFVGRPFLAASWLSCRLSGRTFNGAGVPAIRSNP